MYFIFKHVKFSRYKDVKGKVYHYNEKSPNFEKVNTGARVLLYEKENNEIFALAMVARIKVSENNGKNFFAFYKNCIHFEKPLELSYETRKKVGLRNLELPSPGIIPITKQTFKNLIETIKNLNTKDC
ncbi:MAG: hypothetical protein QMD14_04800 [Candidatus Aenigmarchaeota archaeon]|nr:hypothetical protein [Candidatus Aenigmarchaeota archaeon]